MQDLSFSFPTPHFQLGGFEFSVLIYTFRNVYAPDEAQMTVEQPGDTLWAEGKGLRWAGGQGLHLQPWHPGENHSRNTESRRRYPLY